MAWRRGGLGSLAKRNDSCSIRNKLNGVFWKLHARPVLPFQPEKKKGKNLISDFRPKSEHWVLRFPSWCGRRARIAVSCRSNRKTFGAGFWRKRERSA